MDFDKGKLDKLCFSLRAIKYIIYTVFLIYLGVCGYFLTLGKSGFDQMYLFYSVVILAGFIISRIISSREKKCSDSLLVNLNYQLEEYGEHVRAPTPLEKRILETFFVQSGLEVPIYFTHNNPPCHNAYMVRFQKTPIYLVTERLYQDFPAWSIWAILAHERGHLQNRDWFWHQVEFWLYNMTTWVSSLVLVKILLFSWFYAPNFFYGLHADLVIFALVAYMQFFGKTLLLSTWFSAREVLADMRAVEMLGSASWILETLTELNDASPFSDFPLRCVSLQSVLKHH